MWRHKTLRDSFFLCNKMEILRENDEYPESKVKDTKVEVIKIKAFGRLS